MGSCLTHVGGTGSRRICSIAGRTKRYRERKQRLREKRCRSRNREGPPHPATRTDARAAIAGDRNPKKRSGGLSCGAIHSQACELVGGYTAQLLAGTLAISRSSLHYRKKPRGSRANRTYNEQILMTCGEKLAYGYRRVTWWLQRKKGLPVNRKRVLRALGRTRAAGALTTSACMSSEGAGPRGSQPAQSDPAVRHDEDLDRSAMGRACFVSEIDCCTREIVGWNLSHRSRTEAALAAVEQAVLEPLPESRREASGTLTTDNDTQFTCSCFLETLSGLGVTHRRTA